MFRLLKKSNREEYKRVIGYAKEKGYKSIKYIGKWKGYNVYEPIIFKHVMFTGLPLVILVNNEKIRMSNGNEAMDILKEL